MAKATVSTETVEEAGGDGFDFADVAKIAATEDEGYEFHVNDHMRVPMFYKGEPVTMTVAGTYSKLYRDLDEAFQRKRWKGNVSLDGIQRAREVAVLAPCILRWKGFRQNGTLVSVTPELAVKALRTPWLRPQIDEAMSDHESFFGSSSET